jgi:hypothetical protein
MSPTRSFPASFTIVTPTAQRFLRLPGVLNLCFRAREIAAASHPVEVARDAGGPQSLR